MSSIRSEPHEVMAMLLYGDEKRRVHFRIVDTVGATEIERRFGLTEYLYCEKHLTWHEQRNEAYVPVTEWSTLVGYSELLSVYAKPIAEQSASKKSNADGEENETMPAKPIHKLEECIPQPNPIQTVDEPTLRQYGYETGCGPTGR